MWCYTTGSDNDTFTITVLSSCRLDCNEDSPFISNDLKLQSSDSGQQVHLIQLIKVTHINKRA